ncbi:MAG TPA: SET domain-containing protein-lysine N-methyltransferase [Saprospiraceae bacterium]|nr:SET domain-containing protein-lysine N-methyltransferase [Saprospiraceae bacterium]
MSKVELLAHLAEENFIYLKPSPLHGIGVFALREIQKGCSSIFSNRDWGWEHLSYDEVAELPSHSQFMIETYCLFDDKGYYVPSQGFTIMDQALFLNHSETPNIASINEGEKFVALRTIMEGEELVIDYGSICSTQE